MAQAGRQGGECIRVLVVDDQARFRRLAATILSAHGGFEVVGQAETGEQGVTLALQLRPRMVLMDVRLPGIDGPEATRRILRHHPATTVVLVSTSVLGDLPADVATCGAAGFVAKEELAGDTLATFCAAQS